MERKWLRRGRSPWVERRSYLTGRGHPPRVFVSYRRSDSPASAGRLSDRLADRFGDQNVFFDVETIPPGVDFREYIRDAVESCDVLLVVIGPRWVTATDDRGQPRLHNPDDFVRLEIEYALDANKRVIPVFVDAAAMPGPVDLPETLARLPYRMGEELTHAHWSQDFRRLVDRLVLPRPRRFGKWDDIKRLAPLGALVANALRRPAWANIAVPLLMVTLGIVLERWWLIPVAIATFLAFAFISLFDLEEARQVHARVRQSRAVASPPYPMAKRG